MRTLNDENMDRPGNEPTTQEYDELVYFKEMSILIREGQTKYWIPRSQIEEDFTDEELMEMKKSGEPGEFTIPEWLYESKTEAEERKKPDERMVQGKRR